MKIVNVFKYLREKLFVFGGSVRDSLTLARKGGSPTPESFTSFGENTVYVPPYTPNIGEPVLSIVEAMKDIDRWETTSGWMCDNARKHTITDKLTGFAMGYWWYIRDNCVAIYSGNEWMTEGEKKYVDNALSVLHNQLQDKQLQQEVVERCKALNAERQRIMKLYIKEEEK